MAVTFIPSHYERLHRILADAISSPSRVATSNDWYIAFDRSRGELADLATAKTPNDAERREIESGKVTIEGVSHSLNADFAQQSIHLAQQLEVSERFAASLLQAGMQARAKYGRSAIEVACILYYRERLAAVLCLKELVSGAATLQRDPDDPAARRLGAKMQQLVDALLAGKLPLPQRILKEIESLEKARNKIISARRGQQPSQAFSDEIQIQRVHMLGRIRQELGHILYLLSASQCLGSQGILAVTTWLAGIQESNYQDPMIIYLLTVLLNSLEIPAEDTDFNTGSLMDDISFVKQMHEKITKGKWMREARSVLLLQWCLFLAEATKRSPGLENELKVHQDTLHKLFNEAVHGDALYFIVLRILAFRQREIDALEGEENDTTEMVASKANGDSDKDEEEVDTEFQEYVLTQVQELVLAITSVMLPFVRKLQRSEEDASFAIARSTSTQEPSRRYDIEALFDIVALLCRARPEAGLPFWIGAEGKGTRFLNWAIEVREPGHQRALFDMLVSLSAGHECAWHAHTLLTSGDAPTSHSSTQTPGLLMQQARFVSWSKLFDWVQQYIDDYQSPATAAHPVTSGQGMIMSPSEAVILRSFFRLVRNVAYYSVAAREALYQHTSYQLIPRLFALYACPIIIEVKASILDALSAFAHPSGANATKITSQMWAMLESTIGVSTTPSRPGASSSSLAGAHHDLQIVEVPARIYPVTTSLVNFLKSLIHAPQQSTQEPIDAITGATSTSAPFQGLALTLGQGQRTPGLDPYVDFVIDSVLLQASTREYSDPNERWRVTSACLDFVERCLMSYDLSGLLSGEVTDAASLATLVLHPAFNLMRRILTATRLFHEILNTLNPNAGVAGAVAGFEVINTNRANTLFFASSVRHCMRIVQRVLQIQDGFLQVLLPTLTDATGQLPQVDVAARIGHPSLYTPLDALLLHAHQSAVQIALYVNCTRNDIALLSVRIVGLLANSSAFSGVDRFGGMGYNRKMNRFVGLLEMSDEADRIRAGVVDRLEAEADEPVSDLDAHVKATLALMKIAGQDDDADELQKIVAPTLDADEAIRLAILDLLIANTTFQKDSPNIAHLLLGYDLRAVRAEEQVIADADAVDTPPCALHAILALLRPDPDGATLSLAQRSPAFAEKCHLLISNLCKHPYTSTATLRYLRTKENFFSRQLHLLSLTPVKRASSEHGALGTLIQPDGGHLTTTVDALVSSLQIRSHVLAGVALELHTLCNAGMWPEAGRLVAVLLGRESVLESPNGWEDEDDGLDELNDSIDGQQIDQRGMRLLEILSSLDFEWHDARDEGEREPTVLRNLDLSQAHSQQLAREFDIRATLRLLAAARQELERRGDLVDSRQRADFDKDASLVLEHVSSRNARRVITLARCAAMQSWRNTLDMTFSRGSHLIKTNSRSNIILDCLGSLLPRLSGSSNDSNISLTDLVAGAVLNLLTRLRQHQSDASNDVTSITELPVDRLLVTLRALIAAVVEPGTLMQVRGNLYSAIINYLQLVKTVSTDDVYLVDDGASTLDGGSEIDDSFSFTGLTSGTTEHKQNRRVSHAEARSRTLLASHAERLVPIIARDALDASDVWRTVAFTLFDRLAALQSSSSSSRNLLLDILSKKGFLKSFVVHVREMDLALQEVLKPDPSSLNAMYVYESSMAFFIRLAQTRRGSERLVDARIFDVLSQVDFLQDCPQAQYPYAQDDEYSDLDTFLPAVTSRYESLLQPALQLSVSILYNSFKPSSDTASSFGLRSTTAASLPAHAIARQALSFLQAHRSTLLVSLRNATSDLISLSALEQAQLVVNLLVFILPILDDDALTPPKPLSHFHHAALLLSANFLYEPHWKSRVVPHTEAEREEAATALEAPSPFDEQTDVTSVFDIRAQEASQRLLSALLAYLERASEFTGVDERGVRRVRPCLTSSLYTHSSKGASVTDEFADLSSSGRYGLHASRSAHIPSLGTALASLDESIKRANHAFLALDKMHNMLENADNVRLDEWNDVLASTAAGQHILSSGLAPVQRKSLALKLLRMQQATRRGHLLFALNAIEILLTLLYRHFAYYIALGSQDSNPSSGLLRTSLPSAASNINETVALVRDGHKICSKVLERLDDVFASLDLAHTIPHAEERKAFLAMLARKLQGILLDRLDSL